MPVFFQYLLPKHLLSRLVGRIAASERPWIKSTFINIFCLFYRISLEEAERQNRSDYKSFNDFFTRSLRPGARQMSGKIVSPADGTVAAMGRIDGNTLIQSKKHNYTVEALLADNDIESFDGGMFITIYLAPHNYHRVHAPQTAELYQATYVPGDLFSVNLRTTRHVPGLFARNERLVCRLRTVEGEMALVMVGAMLVAGIKPVWLDHAYQPRLQIASEMRQTFSRGAEIGHFEMGSTVILLFPKAERFRVKIGDTVQVGQPLTA